MSVVLPPAVEMLHTILSDEAEAYRQLVQLARREHTALQHENLPELVTATRDKEVLMAKLGQWEQKREQLVAHLAKELKLPYGATLSDLIVRLDDTIAHKLSALRQEFVNLMEQLLTLNHSNRLLLQAGLTRVEATFDFLASIAIPADGSYTATGGSHVQSQAAAGNVLNWEI
jgi:flagellar biosynthesis/type III secretory pathway chaperone